MTLNVASAKVVPRTEGQTMLRMMRTLPAPSRRAASIIEGSSWPMAA